MKAERTIWSSDQILAELMKLHEQSRVTDHEWRVLVHVRYREWHYLSGLPFLFTGYAERAFVFGSRAEASRVARHISGTYRIIGRTVAKERVHG